MNHKNEVYWYTLKKPNIKKLTSDLSADIAIIGGGMAGLTCAQSLSGRGYRIVLLEKDFCGSGASGKSSGFITPDSELELSHLIRRFGAKGAKELWDFVTSGVEHIRKTILDNKIDCDYQIQDSFFVANTKQAFKKIISEHNSRQSSGYESTLSEKENLETLINSQDYEGGVKYGGTFGINAYLYCQKLKEILEKQGVHLYEDTEAVSLTNEGVKTRYNFVYAKKIIICLDRFSPSLGVLKKEIYSAQTFLTVSSPLSLEKIKSIFPKERLMVWDSDLIYKYYRLTGDDRLLFGGGSLLYTYIPFERQNSPMILRNFRKYIQKKLGITIDFEYIWSGLIGVTKDFLPVAGRDRQYNNAYYIAGSAGLPWAAALGNLIAEAVESDINLGGNLFDRHRKYPISGVLQKFISKPIAFSLSHGIVKYFHK